MRMSIDAVAVEQHGFVRGQHADVDLPTAHAGDQVGCALDQQQFRLHALPRVIPEVRGQPDHRRG